MFWEPDVVKLRCPECHHVIPASKINVDSDVAVCPGCDDEFELSDLLANESDESSERLPSQLFRESPPGAWFVTDEDSWQVGATTRSPEVFLVIPFMVVWTTITVARLYSPQLASGKFNLLASLVGLAFLAPAVYMGLIVLMMVCGKVTVTVINDEGLIFTGVGSIGWKRRFRWSDVQRIVENYCKVRHARSKGLKKLQFEGQTRLSFASMVSEPRRHFMLHVLKRMKAGIR